MTKRPQKQTTETAKESEAKIQQDCFVWFWNTFPALRKTLFHVPNGGYRGRVAGNKMKSIGVVAGIPDFIFVHAGSVYFIELKTDTGSTSPKQKEIRFIFAKQGFQITTIRSLTEFQNHIHGLIN